MEQPAADSPLIELSPSRRRPGQVEIRAAGRLLATLSPTSVTALDIRPGQPLTPDLQPRLEHRAAIERAHKAACDALARRPMTTAEIRERLARRAFDPAVITETIASLTQQGLLNDADVAREIVRQAVAHAGAGSSLVESKLAAKGIDTDTAQRALDEELPEPGASARDAARRRAHSLPVHLSPDAKARRLYAYLARRGFDEHDAADAVHHVLGTDPAAGADE